MDYLGRRNCLKWTYTGKGIYSKRTEKVKMAQSCLTLCDPMDYMVHRILQVWILEWVAFLFSRGSFQPRDRTQVSLIAGGFFTSWATNEVRENRGAHKIQRLKHKSTLRQSLALLCLFLPSSCFIFPQPALQFSQLSMCQGKNETSQLFYYIQVSSH